MLCAHLDVVPTPDLHLWKTADGKPIDPFAGEIHPFGQVIDANGRPATSTTAADGESLRNGPSVWGRGAIDNKHNVVMQLQAVEEALASGTLRPQRTVYLAYGHDEEIGGKQAKQASKQANELPCCGHCYNMLAWRFAFPESNAALHDLTQTS
jgi:acetylornithine deacetylase/succinyl-diaminopimelate desuccinylase-like protein